MNTTNNRNRCSDPKTWGFCPGQKVITPEGMVGTILPWNEIKNGAPVPNRVIVRTGSGWTATEWLTPANTLVSAE